MFFAFDADEAEQLRAEWAVSADADSARGRGGALPGHRRPAPACLREITADPETVAVVVMPELIFSGMSRALHNQRALYIKRLLLFEPRVILASVPYRLD